MKDLGRPAFPVTWRMSKRNETGYVEHTHLGMDLRDYFAAKAMQGMLANIELYDEPHKAARFAYEIADAMLKEREK